MTSLVMMISSMEVEFVSPISCPPSSVVVRVAAITKRWKVFLFFFLFFFWLCVSWDFPPYLMRSGGARCVVAAWCNLRGGFNAPLHVTRFSRCFFQFSVLNFLNFLPSLSSSLFTFPFALCFPSCHYWPLAAIVAMNLLHFALSFHRCWGMASFLPLFFFK